MDGPIGEKVWTQNWVSLILLALDTSYSRITNNLEFLIPSPFAYCSGKRSVNLRMKFWCLNLPKKLLDSRTEIFQIFSLFFWKIKTSKINSEIYWSLSFPLFIHSVSRKNHLRNAKSSYHCTVKYFLYDTNTT